MRVQQVGKVNFGHVIVADSGASNRQQGSLKMSLVTDAGQELDTFSGTMADKPFVGDKDYLDGLTEKLFMFEHNNTHAVNALEGNDRALNGIVIYAPAATIDNKANVFANLVKTDGTPLRDIDYNTIIPNLKKLLSVQAGIHSADDLKLIATNDMIGTGSALAKQLVLRGDLKEGYQGAFYMAGGGLGAGEIQVVGDKVLVKSTESGHTRISGAGKTLKTAESAGASSTALIRNFSEALGLSNAKTAAIIRTGNAKIPMQFIIASDDADAKEIEALRSTKAFTEFDSIVVEGEKLFRLKGVSEKAHQQASRKAVGKFIDVIARMSADRAVEGANQVILTGPLTSGIGKDLQHNPELFGGKSLVELIATKTFAFLDQAGQNMAKLNKFIIADNIRVGNNTEGGLIALMGKFTQGRGNWLEIPLESLKQAAKRV
jgi:hypothetical protein